MPAPDRLLEEVFARTEVARQERHGWAGRVRGLVRGRGRERRGAGVQRGLVGLAAIVVVTLVAVSAVARIGAASGAASISPTPTPSPQPGATVAGAAPTLVVERSTASCAHRGTLTVVPAAPGTRSSAWVTCGADSEEFVLGSGISTRRPGLGAIATDGSIEWAISGDSVVRLDPDRSIAQTVRIGTPAAIAIGSGAVWVLDARTGELSSIAAAGIVRTVTPAADRHVIAVAIAGGSLWALDQTARQLLRLDIVDGHLLGSVPVPDSSTFLASAAGALYVSDQVTGTIVRVDPATSGATTLRPDLGYDDHIDALGGSADTLVLGSRTAVFRLDPITGEPESWADSGAYVDAVAQDGATVLVLQDGTFLEASLP